MELLKKIPFKHQENNYEICIHHQDNLINIAAFLNNHPVNGFRYQIQIPKNVEIEILLVEENFNNFIDLAKNDIVDYRWQNFTKLFK